MAPPLKPNLLIFFVCKEETTWSQSREGAGPSLSLSRARALSLYLSQAVLGKTGTFSVHCTVYVLPCTQTYRFIPAHTCSSFTHALNATFPDFFNLVFLHLQKFLGFQRDTIYRTKGHLRSFSILRDSTCKCNPSVIVARLLFLILALFMLACNYASG